jgi:hypothetical protein
LWYGAFAGSKSTNRWPDGAFDTTRNRCVTKNSDNNRLIYAGWQLIIPIYNQLIQVLSIISIDKVHFHFEQLTISYKRKKEYVLKDKGMWLFWLKANKKKNRIWYLLVQTAMG